MRRGLVSSRQAALEAITAGRVTVGGAPADKPARLVDSADAVRVIHSGRTWVSRGGHKLTAALERWDIPVDHRRCLDAGSSTGGFTDVLLSRGAAQVWAVDVGRGQLHERLRRDPRVVARDKTNIRLVELADLGGVPFDLVVADLSFISLRTVAPVLAGTVASVGADLVLLVKPQFEVGRDAVTAGRGVVRDSAAWLSAVVAVGSAFQAEGAAIMGVMSSPVKGAEGNTEFLLWARARSEGGVELVPAAAEAVHEVDV